MYAQVEKPKESRSKATANAVARKPDAVNPAHQAIQRFLDISSSPNEPYQQLRFSQFRAVNKRFKVDVEAWQWLKKVAQSPLKVTFSTWRNAINSYAYYLEISKKLKEESENETEFRYGDSPADSINQRDARGLNSMLDYILRCHHKEESTFVSLGGSADFFGTAIRLRGGQVVDIPLSGVKDENLQGKQRERAKTFINTCLKGTAIRQNIVIMDAISTGSALIILKKLLCEAAKIEESRIKLLGLNDPPGAEGKEVVKRKEVDIVPSNSGDDVKYVKSRIQNQSYKDIGRKYPKNPVGDITDETAKNLISPQEGMSDKLMVLIFSMLKS